MVAQLFFGAFEILFPVLLLALLLVILLAISNRGVPDPTGERPFVVYLLSVTFIALFLTLFAGSAVVSAVLDWASGDGGISIPVAYPDSAVQEECSVGPDGSVVCGDSFVTLSSLNPGFSNTASAAVGLAGAGLLLWFHWKRARPIVDRPGFADGPARPAYETYLYATLLVGSLAFIAAAVMVGRAVALALPGGYGNSESVTRTVVTYGALAVGAFLIARAHWNRAEALRARPADPVAAAPTAPVPLAPSPAAVRTPSARKPALRKPAQRKRPPARPS